MLKKIYRQNSVNCLTREGSATTAHAVMQMNIEDGKRRKFIMVQLPEQTKEKSEAYKAGYKNICEIGKERIRRAGRKIKEDAGLTAPTDLDIGFRCLRLDESNMEDVYYVPDEVRQNMRFSETVVWQMIAWLLILIRYSRLTVRIR